LAGKAADTFIEAFSWQTDHAEKDLKKLKSRKFVCAPDAENEAKIWAAAHPHHKFKSLQVVPFAEKVEKRRGRPRKEEPLNLSFKIEDEI
jgi:transposase